MKTKTSKQIKSLSLSRLVVVFGLSNTEIIEMGFLLKNTNEIENEHEQLLITKPLKIAI